MGGLYDKWATNRNRDDLLEGFGATRRSSHFDEAKFQSIVVLWLSEIQIDVSSNLAIIESEDEYFESCE